MRVFFVGVDFTVAQREQYVAALQLWNATWLSEMIVANNIRIERQLGDDRQGWAIYPNSFVEPVSDAVTVCRWRLRRSGYVGRARGRSGRSRHGRATPPRAHRGYDLSGVDPIKRRTPEEETQGPELEAKHMGGLRRGYAATVEGAGVLAALGLDEREIYRSGRGLENLRWCIDGFRGRPGVLVIAQPSNKTFSMDGIVVYGIDPDLWGDMISFAEDIKRAQVVRRICKHLQ